MQYPVETLLSQSLPYILQLFSIFKYILRDRILQSVLKDLKDGYEWGSLKSFGATNAFGGK